MNEEALSEEWYLAYRALVTRTNIPKLEREMVNQSSDWLRHKMAMHKLDEESSASQIRRLRGQRDTAKNRERVHFAIEQKIRHEMLAERIRQELDQDQEGMAGNAILLKVLRSSPKPLPVPALSRTAPAAAIPVIPMFAKAIKR